MSVKFKYLFSPLKIGPVTIPNRVMLTGHTSAHMDDGIPKEELCYYQAERAKGGCGLIVYGFCNVAGPAGKNTTYENNSRLSMRFPAYPRGRDPRTIPPLTKMADMVHQHGSKIFYQIGASGVWMGRWGPSPTVDPEDPRMTNAQMTEEQIEWVLDGFRIATENAKKAGFDGIEVHDHGGIAHNFMSPLTNRRKDKWGGSLDNRLRFLNEAIKRTKEGAGSDMAVITRLCVDEFIPGGIGPMDGAEIAKKLEPTVDALDIDIGIEPSGLNTIVAPLYVEPGYQLYGVEAIKEAGIKIPIGCVGRINDPIFAEKILADGKADFVGICRGQIADPEFCNKAKAGRLDDIRPCIYENEGCMKTGAVQCSVNASVGHEMDMGIGTIKPAQKRKKILVAGAGPAGMEFARIAAMRGHDVTIYERSNDVGGSINLAMKLPGRMEYDGFKRWLKMQVDKLGVKVVLNKEVTPELVKSVNPDVVVVAAGARPYRDGFNSGVYCEIDGWNSPNVCVGEDILEGKVDMNKLGQRVIIYDQVGYDEALGLAEMLADAGKTVDIRGASYYIGGNDTFITLQFAQLYGRALSKGVKFSPMSLLMYVNGKTGGFMNGFTNEMFEVEADNFVLCASKRPNDELFWQLIEQGFKDGSNLFRLGDANAPHNLADATFYANELARKI